MRLCLAAVTCYRGAQNRGIRLLGPPAVQAAHFRLAPRATDWENWPPAGQARGQPGIQAGALSRTR